MYDTRGWAGTCHPCDTPWASLEALDDAEISIRAQQLGDASLCPTGRACGHATHRGDISRPLLPLVATLGTQEADEALYHTPPMTR